MSIGVSQLAALAERLAETIIARIGPGIITTIGSSQAHANEGQSGAKSRLVGARRSRSIRGMGLGIQNCRIPNSRRERCSF